MALHDVPKGTPIPKEPGAYRYLSPTLPEPDVRMPTEEELEDHWLKMRLQVEANGLSNN